MDLFIGIVIGVALMGVAFVIARAVKKRKQKPSDEPHSSTSTSFDDTQKETKKAAYQELRDRYDYISTRDEHTSLLREIESKQSRLNREDYDRLVRLLNEGIQALDAAEQARSVVEPKLAQFRRLKNVMNREELFNELHRISQGDETVITYDELEEYGEKGDVEWLNKTYDELLIEQFRTLLVTARTGSVADYRKVMKLWEELEDFYSTDDDDRQEFVTKHLANEWNEMIVRFKRELDWDDDLFTLDDISDEDYPALINKARREGDFLSLRVALLLSDDSSFTDALIENVTEEFERELDSQYAKLGFMPGENLRRD